MTGDKDKRLCISYLDEANAFDIENIALTSIVSLTSLKNNYINDLEKDWKSLRLKYNIPQGTYLHFNEIKKLLTASDKDKYDANILSIFSNKDGNIDYELLYNFYTDVLNIIKNNNFIIQATGIHTLRKSKSLPKFIGINSVMYQLFREHINRMAFYLVHLTCKDLDERKTINPKNNKVIYYKSKIRYDGDETLNYHSDLRDAFSHSLVDGTRNFDSKAAKHLFDNLKFISKEQVALCTNCSTNCGYEQISHAGHEIVDFITIYVARAMWSNYYRDYMINKKGRASKDVDKLIHQLTTISIPGYTTLEPIKIIEENLFSTDEILKYKIIENYPF